jgi:dTDP-4-amino-4,6-dideoxygalactose transaminase
LQAALLRVKLSRLDEWNARRQEVATAYLQQLEGVADLVLPFVPQWAEPVWHLFVVRHTERERLQEHLSAGGTGTLIHYPRPPHLQAAYADLGYGQGDFPLAERMADEVLSLPLGPHLSADAVDYVVQQLSSFAA